MERKYIYRNRVDVFYTTLLRWKHNMWWKIIRPADACCYTLFLSLRSFNVVYTKPKMISVFVFLDFCLNSLLLYAIFVLASSIKWSFVHIKTFTLNRLNLWFSYFLSLFVLLSIGIDADDHMENSDFIGK